MTNADRIRAMTDEEIENWYWWLYKEMTYYTDSYAFVHEWLKHEVDENDKFGQGYNKITFVEWIEVDDES